MLGPEVLAPSGPSNLACRYRRRPPSDEYERDGGLQRRIGDIYAEAGGRGLVRPMGHRGPGCGPRRFGGAAKQQINGETRVWYPGLLDKVGDTMDTMRQRILVVDDDPSLAEMLTIVLRGEGFDTAGHRRWQPGAHRGP